MFIFIDTEFTDFVESELLSLGAVSEDGNHEFYVEITDYTPEARSQFVIDHVMPLMEPATHGKFYKTAAHDLADWVDSLNVEEVVVIVDYHLDATFMREMLMVKVPKTRVSFYYITPAFINMLAERGVTMSSEDELKAMRVMVSETVNYFKTDPRQHHALVDAKANRQGWVKGYEFAIS